MLKELVSVNEAQNLYKSLQKPSELLKKNQYSVISWDTVIIIYIIYIIIIWLLILINIYI